MDHELIDLSEKVAAFITRPEDEEESRFNALALEIFAYQYRTIGPYRKLCLLHGKTPETVRTWTEIPAVPADAFKHFFLFSGGEKDVFKTFRSSGTTRPGTSSQAHFSEAGLRLMNVAVETNAQRRLFQDGKRTRIFVLAPGPDLAPHMIMVHGMNHMISKFGGPEGGLFCVGPEGLKTEALLGGLQECVRQNLPATLMGSSFGFVHLFDRMDASGLEFRLPDGSRLMDAGGYKGRSREIVREDFVELACSRLGLPAERVVNLLGMTEIASQIYDDVNGVRAKKPPHWMRTQVVDPARLRDTRPEAIADANRQGLLRHMDLANVERPMAIQSEDIGVRRGSGFEVLKRAKGAEPRGCSLTMEEFSK